MSEITTAIQANGSPSPKMLVIDLGKKQPKKKIRKLRKGTGPLVKKLGDMLAQLQDDGVAANDSHTVVVVVRTKEKKRKMKFGF